ncbi:hypothetical protein GMJLKIPL_5822 [Methylobacterium isbiliense]|uniref:Uncharacterized protein n=1 Tax=Methylobacterium isbiliense TaxID=315478 RepID=A0ABQ4SMW0_9HYPH|nr:hypothetical protein GMJLKIPL_5822 [Methylobacterium isbiliense]
MAGVRGTLERGLLGSALARRRDARVDERRVEDLASGLRNAVAVERIRVHVAEDQEALARGKPAGPALVVSDVAALARLHVIREESDLVGVAQAVAVLGPVEGRGRRMRGQDVHRLAVDVDGHVPVALGGQAEDGEFLGRVEVLGRRRGGVVGQAGARHVLPEEVLEGPRRRGIDRIAREQHHPVLAGEVPEAERVVAVARRARSRHGHAVVVEVEAGRDARVRRGDEHVGIVDRRLTVLTDGEVVAAEEVGRQGRAVGTPVVVVEFIDKDDIRRVALDDLCDRPRLAVAGRAEIIDQCACRAAVERGIEGCDAKRVRNSRRCHRDCPLQTSRQETSTTDDDRDRRKGGRICSGHLLAGPIATAQDADASISIPGRPGIDGAVEISRFFDARSKI